MAKAPYGQIDGCASPIRSGALPVPSKYSSGTFIQSAMPSNRLTLRPLPMPGDAALDQRLQHPGVRAMPQAMSQAETPTRPGPAGCPVIIARPDLGLHQQVVRLHRRRSRRYRRSRKCPP